MGVATIVSGKQSFIWGRRWPRLGSKAASYLECLKFNPHEPVFCGTIEVVQVMSNDVIKLQNYTYTIKFFIIFLRV